MSDNRPGALAVRTGATPGLKGEVQEPGIVKGEQVGELQSHAGILTPVASDSALGDIG